MSSPTKKTRPKIVLASQSPRRKELLIEAGFEFTVCAPDDSVEKGVCSSCGPDQLVVDSAVAKQRPSRKPIAQLEQTANDCIIIAADTVGVCKAEVLGKPVDVDHAMRMLQLMSGTVHDVLTGVCLWHKPSNQFLNFLEKTSVRMEVLTEEMIEDYLDTDLWIGKAGGFGFQDGLDWVHIVEGLASTVVGLPVEKIDGWIDLLLEKVNQQ